MITAPNPLCIGPIIYTKTITDWVAEAPSTLELIHESIIKYLNGNWGDIGEEDWQMNTETVTRKTSHGRLMGSYKISDDRTLWIITDGYGMQDEGVDYCYTTILSPDDY